MRHHILDCTDRAYQVRVAKESDVESILELLVNAAEWLATKETSQWDYYITDLEGNTKEVVDSIAKASTFLVEIDNEVVASVTLEKEPNDWDQEIWGADSKREDVMYLHRLVVHRNYTNKQIGTNLLKWCERYVKEQGKNSIRFDCVATNKGLTNYYQKMYKLTDIANIHGGHCKYEITL